MEYNIKWHVLPTICRNVCERHAAGSLDVCVLLVAQHARDHRAGRPQVLHIATEVVWLKLIKLNTHIWQNNAFLT